MCDPAGMLPRMSDDSAAASILDRVNTLSAPAVAGLGAVAGVLLAVLSALSVEPSSSAEAAAHRAAVGADTQATATPASAAHADAAVGDSQASGAAEAVHDSGRAAGDPGAKPDVEAEADAEDGASEASDDLDDDPEDVVLLDPDVGASDEADLSAPLDPGAPAAEESAASAGTPPASPTRRTQSDRDAEAKMDADALLAAASEAYQEKRYKDAYRLSTRSQRARPKDKAQMLRGRSACRLRDEKNAREIVRSFKLGDEHRKTLRTFCKDRGVRVGL